METFHPPPGLSAVRFGLVECTPSLKPCAPLSSPFTLKQPTLLICLIRLSTPLQHCTALVNTSEPDYLG